MNGPPMSHDGASDPEGDRPDALDRAYQRAGAGDTSRPGPQVRLAILAQARRAANDVRWGWRVAASIAVLGLAGVLGLHWVRVAPPAPAVAPRIMIADADTERARPRAASPSSSSAPSAIRKADEGWPERVLRTARMLYPEFSGTVTIALNADGTVYASAQASRAGAVPAARDAPALIDAVLGVAPAELASSGVLAPADGVIIVYGVRAARDVSGTSAR